jgi:hypothetical protein
MKKQPKKQTANDQVNEAARKLMELCHSLKIPVLLKWMDHDKDIHGYWSAVHTTLEDREAGWRLYDSMFTSFEQMAPGLEVIVRNREESPAPPSSGMIETPIKP